MDRGLTLCLKQATDKRRMSYASSEVQRRLMVFVPSSRRRLAAQQSKHNLTMPLLHSAVQRGPLKVTPSVWFGIGMKQLLENLLVVRRGGVVKRRGVQLCSRVQRCTSLEQGVDAL